MPRGARTKCETGIYHVIVRGINRQDIFHEKKDFMRFLEIVAKVKKMAGFELYGYCLMSNHIHLLLSEKCEDIAKVMKRIGVSYAWWYNQKYDRTGHVFQGRFKSEAVETDQYLINVLRYIHNNPVKAEITAQADQYPWSSCGAYGGKYEFPPGLTDTQFVAEILANGGQAGPVAMDELAQISQAQGFLDNEPKRRIRDEQLAEQLQVMLEGQPISALLSMEKQQRDELIRRLKAMEGITLRQIARVTGFSSNMVFRA